MEETTDPRSIERDLADQLVRAFAGVDALLQDQYANDFWQTPDRVAERLAATVASRLAGMAVVFGPEELEDASGLVAEAADNLGRGEQLDPWDVLAFRAPVGVRSHGVVLEDRPVLSPDVEAVRAALLARGITVLGEDRDQGGRRTVYVTRYAQDAVAEAVRDLLPEVGVHWLGQTPRRIVPAPCVDWRAKGDAEIRVWVRVAAGEHIDEVVAAEDDEQVVVLAFVCTPELPGDGIGHHEPARVHLTRPLGDRVVVDGCRGRRLPVG